MPRRKFAFLVHPRADIGRDLGRRWPMLRRVPAGVYDAALRALPLPPVVWNTVYLDDQPDEPAGWIITIMAGARQLLHAPRRKMVQKIETAVDRAIALGAELVGLGALTAPVMQSGRLLNRRTDVSITNGNAFTAYMTVEAMERILEERLGPDAHVAVVGASGSVGRCVAKLAARRGLVRRLSLVARNPERLQATATMVHAEATDLWLHTSTDMATLREADLVVLLTSAADHLLHSEHLKPGAIVLDDTQPRNTSPTLRTERPDVLVIDGGVVLTPGVRRAGPDIGLPSTHSYACLAETLLLALDGHQGHFVTGSPTVEQAEHMDDLARAYHQFGFTLAPFASFGRPIPAPYLAHAA